MSVSHAPDSHAPDSHTQVARPHVARRVLASVTACWLLASGCVYYNGIYNAKEAARSGDALLRRESESEANGQFQISAARAETVLVRHPTSSWRPRALYLAGRGMAFSAQCERAIPLLTEFLALPGSIADDRDRARVALASCELRTTRIPTARLRLDSLVDVPNKETARQARLWAARSALAAGDRDAVAGYLRDLNASALQWELISSSLAASEYARAESLLTAQAANGDYRDEASRVLRDLWAAGRIESAEAILRRYDGSRVREDRRAAMHYALGELNVRAGRDTVARRHLLLATSLAGRDSVTLREATIRLALLSLSTVTSTREVDSVFARQDSVARNTLYARRVQEQVLLVSLLEKNPDPTGASLYLAAEVARDSLRAPELAQTLFLRVARDVNGSPLVPQAYYAAALLVPDSAPQWHARIRSDFPNSAVAAFMRGDDPGAKPDFVSTPELLKFSWIEGARLWADSVRKLRTARVGPTPVPVKK